jgi:hypothetical protein
MLGLDLVTYDDFDICHDVVSITCIDLMLSHQVVVSTYEVVATKRESCVQLHG